jgi:hypothetical protein
MAPEQLIGAVILVVILLINLLGRLLATRPEEESGEEVRPAPRLLPSPPAPFAPSAARPQRNRREVKSGPRVAVPPARVTRFHQLGLTHRRTLRHAMVLMTVLGPCRGLERLDTTQ